MTSKELVLRTLEFENTSGRVPRDLWVLPWAEYNYPEQLSAIRKKYPPDITGVSLRLKEKGISYGDMYGIGEYTDDFGCVFTNAVRGIIGEVKKPLVTEEDWDDYEKVHIPYEWLSFDIGEINSELDKVSDKFTILGCPRPFEQLQFIRGTENFYVDLITRPEKMLKFKDKLHTFYCEYLEKLSKTKADALQFMDDWGSQKALLINPVTWRELFKPMYKDYIEIAKRSKKKIFMHSDGYITDIIPDLIELGLDAVNCQIFCMGTKNLSEFRGKITFWGEIDRQHLLPYGSRKDIENAVKSVYENLWQDGGCIAQCEFGIGARPENIEAVYSTWDNIRR